jgi:hypothetical protein
MCITALEAEESTAIAKLEQASSLAAMAGAAGSKKTRACIVLYLAGQLNMIRRAKVEAHALTSGV